jgi:hypothetical protein
LSTIVGQKPFKETSFCHIVIVPVAGRVIFFQPELDPTEHGEAMIHLDQARQKVSSLKCISSDIAEVKDARALVDECGEHGHE